MAKKIKFNSRTPEYAFLSAFYPGPFVAPLGKKLVLFPHREAYYQAHKTKDKTFRAKIVNSLEGGRAKYFGSAKSGCPIIEGFDKRREAIMREAIRYQMTQQTILRRLLRDTRDATLIEDAYWDDFFGSGRDGKGKNIHGKLLMEFRDTFSDSESGEYQAPAPKIYDKLSFYPYIQPERNNDR